MPDLYDTLRTEVAQRGMRGAARAGLSRINPYRRLYETLCCRLYSEQVLSFDRLEEQYWTSSLPEEAEFVIDAGISEPLPEYFEQFVGKYSPEPRWVCELPDATLVGDKAMVFTNRGSPVSPFTKESTELVCNKFDEIVGSDAPLLTMLWRDSTEARDSIESDLVFPLVGLWCTNYYHWIAEYLPRVRALEQYISETGRTPTPIIHADAPRWARDSLDAVGVSPEQCLEWTGGVARANQVVLSSHRVKTGGYYGIYDVSVEDCTWTRERVRSNLGTSEQSERDERIYISRQKASSRRVANFDEVERVLCDHGFQIYRLEELDFADQVALFSRAECVVGPHGSGLVNTLFAPEGTRVVELLPAPENNSHYFRLCRMLGHTYQYVTCQTARGEDLRVDTDELGDRLSRI